MTSPIIDTCELVKSFGNTPVLDKLNLKVPKGISGFIGKNGAGKTTTIGVLLGLLKSQSGQAKVFGLDCWQDSYKIRKRLGVVHEINPYPGSFTGEQFLGYMASFHHVANPKQSAKEALLAVGLTNVQDKQIRTYSAGMYRRLGLAQALIGEPELAILDEPTANIDPLGRIDILNLIVRLHKERGTSFLISTHILSDLEKICDWLSIIDAGKIVDQGPVPELAKKYSANIFKLEVSMPHLLEAKLKTLDFVDCVWIEKGIIYCRVKEPTVFYQAIPRITAELNLQLMGFQRIIGTIEEIYKETASHGPKNN